VKWERAVAQHPRGGEEQHGEQRRVQPQRLVEEEELGDHAKH